MRTEAQIRYTSTPVKLLKHPDRLQEVQNGVFRPVSLQFALTDRCNLNCEFCSNANREGNELSVDEIRDVLTVFRDMGALSVEFTGGEPTLHPHINEIIRFAHLLGYSIGIKTNGVGILSRVDLDMISCLTWIRVSLNSLDYVESLNLEGISDRTTLGFSYVVQPRYNPSMFDTLREYAAEYNASYIRVIPDNMLSPEEMTKLKEEVTRIPGFDDGTFFWQEKDYEIPRYCWMMWLKPFINTDRFIYYCCATQMFEQKFIPRYRLCSTDPQDIRRTWQNPKRYSGTMCKGGICYFKQHNELIEYLVSETEHRDFI